MKSISRALLTLITLVMMAGFATNILAQTQKKYTVKDLPEAVGSAFKKSYPNAVIKVVDKEVENGKTFYEVESMDGTLKRDLLYTPDGKAYEIEESIAAAELPAAVNKAVSKEYPKGKVGKAERTTKEGAVQYDLSIKSGKKMFSVSIAPDGKILSKKEMKAKTEKKEEKEDDEKDGD
jgi:uncharacterized membrane protein YkoI